MPTHFQCLSGSNSAIRKAVFNPFESRNVPRLSEHNGPGGDFTTDRMCFAQLGHFSTLAKWSQVNANGARTVKTLSTILFMGGNRQKTLIILGVREDKIVRPVLLVAVLPQGGRDLGPVPCTVQKDMSYDLSLTAGKRASGACFKSQHRPQIGVGSPCKIPSNFFASSVADTENLVERAGGKSVIRHGAP